MKPFGIFENVSHIASGSGPRVLFNYDGVIVGSHGGYVDIVPAEIDKNKRFCKIIKTSRGNNKIVSTDECDHKMRWLTCMSSHGNELDTAVNLPGRILCPRNCVDQIQIIASGRVNNKLNSDHSDEAVFIVTPPLLIIVNSRTGEQESYLFGTDSVELIDPNLRPDLLQYFTLTMNNNGGYSRTCLSPIYLAGRYASDEN